MASISANSIVRYKASFLKSVGWHVDVPDYGRVTDIVPAGGLLIAVVAFPNEDQPRRINTLNLILADEAHLEPA